MAETIAAILLAGGRSSRLGQSKQLVLIDGEPLLCRTARLALAAGCSPVVVVLGAAETACRTVLLPLLQAHPGALQIISNPAWAEGMSTSLRAGLAEVARTPSQATGPESVLILVTDQPRLTLESLRALLDAHTSAALPMTAARYSGQLGVPAVFRSENFPALGALTGDQGARRLLDPCRTTPVNLPEAAFDLDTPDDLAGLQA